MNKSQFSPPKKDELTQLINDHRAQKRTLNDSKTKKDTGKESLSPEPLILVGVLKDITASSVQFSTANFTDWLTLPMVLIKEATLLGVLKEVEARPGKMFPLYSIVVTRPQTQSEHFFFNLIMPPFFHAAKNSNWTDASFKLSAATESDPTHLAMMGRLSPKRVYRQRRK